MNTVHQRMTWLTFAAAVVLVLSAPAWSGQKDAVPSTGAKPTPAGERSAPLLLDPSLREVGQPARAEVRPQERKDVIGPRPVMMRVAMDVLVDGRPSRTVRHAGKTYIPVPRLGEEYQIRIWNHGPRRIAAIGSVDGLSFISGRPASENDAGYIVAPYSHIVVKGWRRNLETVAAFRFVERDRSYANLMGRPENIGVIGLVAVEEKVVYPMPMLERRDAAKAVGAAQRTEVGSIGTEYGRDLDSRAHYETFLRSNHKQTITYYYDTVEALREAGVPVDRPPPIPFPGDIPFAPPPPGRK